MRYLHHACSICILPFLSLLHSFLCSCLTLLPLFVPPLCSFTLSPLEKASHSSLHALVQDQQRFYADYGIGWVAHPKHDNWEGELMHWGLFKKACNMNYSLSLSLKMEEIICQLEIECSEKVSLVVSAVSDDRLHSKGSKSRSIGHPALKC